jgi:hypothetical protein
MTTSPPSGGRRRERRRWPKVLLGTIAFVLIVSVAFGGFVWWKVTPPAPVDARPTLEQARAALQPPGDHEDAWPGYAVLFRDTLGMEYLHSAGNDTMDLIRATQFHSALLGEISGDEPEARAIRTTLDALKPVLDELMQIADTPRCLWPVMGSEDTIESLTSATDATMPRSPVWADELRQAEMFLLLPFQAMLMFSAEFAYRDCEIMDGNARLRAANFVSMHMHQTATDTFGAGTLWRTLAFQQIRHMVLTHDLTVGEAEDTLRVLRESPARVDLGPVYTTHSVVDAAQFGYLFAHPITDIASLEEWRHVLTRPSPRGTAMRVRSHFERLAPVADVPFRERPEIPEYAHELPYGINTYATLIAVRDQNLTERAATIIILLLERQHALTGEWPTALEDIMPREETLDPNSRTPFVYTLTPDGQFPFSLLAPPEADFIREEDRDFTKPRKPFTPTTSQP